MLTSPTIPAGTTVYTHQLAGASLDELLEAAERDWWPNDQCEAEWAVLRNWAIQTESLMLDEAENLAWEERMRELVKRDLPYPEWIEARGEALAGRTRARKLAQANLRYKYGYRGQRRWALLRKAVRSFYLAYIWGDAEVTFPDWNGTAARDAPPVLSGDLGGTIEGKSFAHENGASTP